jgi:hypothetical protein
MPRVNGKRADDPIVVALDDACLIDSDGAEYNIRAGMRLHSSRPAVRIAPHLFADWLQSDDQDLAEARTKLLVAAGVFV